jgi:uncharacterized protein (TIGR02246 family)
VSAAADILALETAALRRWCAGDPSGFLEISAPEVTYFDPFLDKRLDGLEALAAYYAAIRGKVSAARFEIVEPQVTMLEPDGAVLAFNFVSSDGSEGRHMRWNCTEVYARKPEGWRIVQTHWSFTAGGK